MRPKWLGLALDALQLERWWPTWPVPGPSTDVSRHPAGLREYRIRYHRGCRGGWFAYVIFTGLGVTDDRGAGYLRDPAFVRFLQVDACACGHWETQHVTSDGRCVCVVEPDADLCPCSELRPVARYEFPAHYFAPHGWDPARGLYSPPLLPWEVFGAMNDDWELMYYRYDPRVS